MYSGSYAHTFLSRAELLGHRVCLSSHLLGNVKEWFYQFACPPALYKSFFACHAGQHLPLSDSFLSGRCAMYLVILL